MRKKKVAGEIRSLGAYERIGYECQRCNTIFVSPTGPEVFCESCRRTLENRVTPRATKGTK